MNPFCPPLGLIQVPVVGGFCKTVANRILKPTIGPIGLFASKPLLLFGTDSKFLTSLLTFNKSLRTYLLRINKKGFIILCFSVYSAVILFSLKLL